MRLFFDYACSDLCHFLGALHILDNQMLDWKSQHRIRGNELDSQFIQQVLEFIVCVSEGGPLLAKLIDMNDCRLIRGIRWETQFGMQWGAYSP